MRQRARPPCVSHCPCTGFEEAQNSESRMSHTVVSSSAFAYSTAPFPGPWGAPGGGGWISR